MSTRDGGYFRSDSVKVALSIDQVADEFEAAWLAGQSPRLADFLGNLTGEPRLALVEELVRIDQVYRSKLGTAPSRDDYRAEFPELPAEASWERSPSDAIWRSMSLGDGTDAGRQDRGPSATVPATLMPEIPGYELLCELGRGSMGVVYKARQTALERTVALKMILAGSFAGPEQLGRFQLETQAAARLQHPNIVQVYEVGQYGGLPYCVLEYVDGRSLANTIDGCPQPPRQAAEFVETLALAVHEAHRQDIVHRDLKPANILISADGRPKIADFGLAKHLSADGGYTQSGVAIGTPSYMAVEQAEGRTGDVGPASDVYALGAIFYEMLTGRPPFRGATMLETLEQVRSAELVPPKRLQPSLSRDLETICVKAMAREPSRRYATARALAQDLRRWLDGKPIEARRAGALYKIAKWSRRRPAMAALVVLAMVAAGASAGGAWWHTSQLQRALDQTDQARRQADALRGTSEQHREHAESMVYATDMQLASASYLAGDMFEVSRRLERHLPAPARPDRREFTWKMLWALRQPNELVFQGHRQDAYGVRVVAGGRQLVSAGRDGTLRLWDIADPTHSEILGQFDSEMNFVAVAPNGVDMATGSDDGTVRLWNLATRAQTGHLVAHANWVLCGAISPQGDRLATAGRDNAVRLWTFEGKLTGELKGHTSTIESLVFFPDGRSLASTGSDKTVRLWDLAGGSGSVLGTHSPAFSIACSHDGRLLATGCQDHDVYLWDVETRSLRGRLTGHVEAVQCVEFSPDGARLASAGKDGSVRIWDIAHQAQIESLTGNSARVWSVAWLPDSTGLVSSSGDGMVRLWRRQANQIETALEEMTEAVSSVFLSAPDRCIYKTTNGGTVWVRSANGPSTPIADPFSGRWYLNAWCAAANADLIATAWSDQPGYEAPNRPVVEVVFQNSAGARLLQSLKLTSMVAWVVLDPDATRLAVSYRNGQMELYELPSGRMCWARATHRPEAERLQFSPNASEVVKWASTSNHVDAHSVADGRRRTVVDIEGQTPWIIGLTISPDGRLLATGGADGVIRVWDYRSPNTELKRLDCNDGEIPALAFSPDGRTLAAGTGIGTLILWHVATWQQLARFKTRLGTVHDICFSREGDTLAIAGRTPTGKGQVLLWESDRPSN